MHTATAVSRLAVEPPTQEVLADPATAQIFHKYRMDIVYADLPNQRNSTMLAGAAQVASGLADLIRLLGRWRSDEMLRYLHVQAEPLMRHFARKMVHHGSFQLLPNREVPLY